MNFWSPYPFVQITVAFSTGILLLQLFPLEVSNFSATVISITVIYLVLVIILKRLDLSHSNVISGTLSLLVISYLGFAYASKYSFETNPVSEDVVGYYGVVKSNTENSGKYQRVILDLDYYLLQDSLLPAEGKVLLYIVNDSSKRRGPQYGDYLVVQGRAKQIKPPSNPGEFNFASFWANKQVLWQDFVEPGQVRFIKNDPPNPIINLSFKVRNLSEQYLKTAVTGERELAIAMALILGVKDGLDNDIKSAYAASGAMHVLAVSGLHVGILYLFILYTFKPLRDKKYGALITGLFSLVVLWLYALITGFHRLSKERL